MIGEVIGINSNVEDIHDLIKPLGVDNIDDVFTSCASQRCFNVSKNWVSKQNHSSFSGRMVCLTGKFEYGTPAQIESLIRDNSIQYTYAFVNSVDYVVIGETKENVSSHIIDLARTYGVPVIYESEFLAQLDRLLVPVTNGVARRQITVRPPTMFGEPHVIKAIRLLESNPNSQWGTYPYQE